MNWHEGIEVKELNWTNWNEWIARDWNDSLVHLFPTSSSKSAPNETVFYVFYVKSSSRDSIAHLFPTSSSKSAPNASFFYDFMWPILDDDDVVDIWNRTRATVSCAFSRPHLPKVLRSFLCEINLSLESRAHFVDLIFQKCSERLSCLTCLSANRALASVLCAFRRQLSPIEPRTHGNRDPSATTDATSPEKTQGFAPENVFKPEFTRDLMLMWLTSWWCGCHDGEKAGHDNRPQLGSFLTKLRLIMYLWCFFEIPWQW